MASLPAEDEYEVPLRDQRFFGAGIKRKRIQFVPSGSTGASVTTSLKSSSHSSAADRYLSIVMKREEGNAANIEKESTTSRELIKEDESHGDSDLNTPTPSDEVVIERDLLCETCHRPLSSTPDPTSRCHESSLAHQIHLPHSHPPSHVDRRRLGLTVLKSQGWDPDSRRGLGAEGKGMLHPIKAVDNPARAGIGVKPGDFKRLERERPVKVDAGGMQRLAKANQKKAARLREMFYRSEDVEKYLGQEANGEG